MTDARTQYWQNVAAGLPHIPTAAERAEADKHRQHSAVYVVQEVKELRDRLDEITKPVEEKYVETQPGSPNFDGAEAYEAFLNSGGYGSDDKEVVAGQ